MHPRILVLGLALLTVAVTAPVLAQVANAPMNLPTNWKDGDTICDPGGNGNWPDFRFSASGYTVTCRIQPSDKTPFGGRTPEMLDASACDGEAKGRDNQRLNISVRSSATANTPLCMAVLRFPVQETLPKNATVLSAVMTIWADFPYYNNNPQRTAALDRNLTLTNIFATWDEPSATYDRFRPGTGRNSSAQDINLGFHSTSSAFGGGGAPGGGSGQSPFSGVLGGSPLPKSFRVTGSAACAYEYLPNVEKLRGCEAHTHGWIVFDGPNAGCTQTDDCLQVFYSSAARGSDGQPVQTCPSGGPSGTQVGNSVTAKSYCWPKLDLLLDPNPALPANLKFHYNTSMPHRAWRADRALTPEDAIWMPGNVPFNVSIDGFDAKGRILSGSFEIRNKTGVLFAREDFAKNALNTSGFDPLKDPGDRRRLWTVRAFDLPEDRYYVNVTLRDVDNHLVGRNMTAGRPVLWIDRTPPTMSKLSWPASVPQADVVNLSVELFDERRIDSVHVDITQPSGRLLTFKMRPAESFEGGKRTEWYFPRSWTDPGNYTMRIRANDTLGNVIASGPLGFRVVDIKLPRPCGGSAAAADARFGTYVQEAGGRVRTEGCVLDETALTVATTCLSASGVRRDHPMALRADGRYAANFTAEEPGRHDCAIRARDADANVVELLAFPLLVEPSTPPRPSAFVPLDGGFANATPVASVTYTDLNLDRATIRIDASVNGGPFERAVPGLVGTGLETRAVFAGRRFDVGDTVTLRATANDTLGNAASPVQWTFKIDAKAPRLELTLVGDRAPGPVNSFVKREAKVSYVTDDDLSGVARVEAKWARLAPADAVDASLRDETPWREVVGDLAAVDPQVDRGAATYVVSVRAVDRVGNAAPAEEVRFVLDADPPVAKVESFAGELRIDAADAGSGLASLVVGTRLVGDPTFRVTDLQQELARSPQGGRFAVPTAVVSKGETMEYYVTAVDALGNRLALGSPLQPARIIGINHRPLLTVDAPVNDSEVEGPLEFGWRAVDEDGDDVSVDVELRPSVLDEGEVLASDAPERGVTGWDSRQAPDGLYVLEVRARDGESTTTFTARFVVNNTGTGLGRLVAPTGRVEYLDTVRFEVTLYRPVVDAKVRVFELDGTKRTLVATHVLHDDGSKGDRTAGDGVYTAVYAANAKGEYQTDVEVVYGDAGTVVLPAATTYSVKSSFTHVLERNFLWFLLGGALVVALSAFVIVQLMRYGYI